MSRRITVVLALVLVLGVVIAASQIPPAITFSGSPDNVAIARAAVTWALLNVAIGAILIWKRPGLRYPWFMFSAGLIMAALEWLSFRGDTPGDLYFEVATLPALLAQLFPTGRTVTGRWGWLTYAGAAGYLGLTIGFNLGGASTAPAVVTSLAAVLWVVGLLATLPLVALRFHRSAGVERAQLKWFLFAVAAAVVIWFGSAAVASGSGGWALALGLSFPMVGIVISLLRYRLYDIDRVISRAASYVVVTGLLVMTYLGVVFLATSVLGQKSSLAVAAATLVAAAIFRPVLRRVQTVVDHRFNRARYDATGTVTGFARALDRQVELATIESCLMVAVRQTVSPASLSLWLRSDS